MSTKNAPGAWDCHANAGPDEEMFVLLARDPFAGATVRLWAQARAAVPGQDRAQLEEALACADRLDMQCRALGKEPQPVPMPLSLTWERWHQDTSLKFVEGVGIIQQEELTDADPRHTFLRLGQMMELCVALTVRPITAAVTLTQRQPHARELEARRACEMFRKDLYLSLMNNLKRMHGESRIIVP